MIIRDLRDCDEAVQHAAAELLVVSFADTGSQDWQTLDQGLETVAEACAPEGIARIALNAGGGVLGWVGGAPSYDGKVWELHPLVVAPPSRGRGIGRALVADLETQAALSGGVTLWLGTDDEDGRTSLGGIDLYPDVLERLRNIRNVAGHPFEFYERLGFAITGVMPDANGPGNPDIFMAKRIVPIT